MGEVVILRTDGTAVKLTSDFSEQDTLLDVKGFLKSFKYMGIVYRFYDASDFRKEHQNISESGYYREDKYLLYIQYRYNTYSNPSDTVPNYKTLREAYYFDFKPFAAQKGDMVKVDVCLFGSPFQFYYKQSRFEFTVTNDTAGNIRKYKKPGENKIRIPSNATETPNNVDLNSKPTGYFFKKNFYDLLATWNLTAKEKEKFCERTTLICFKIFYIVKDIFPKLLATKNSNNIVVIDKDLTKIYKAARNLLSPSEFASLNILEKGILHLMKDWGYFYGPRNGYSGGGGALITGVNGAPVINPDGTTEDYSFFNKLFDGSANYFQYENYFTILVNFHLNLYNTQDVIADEDVNKRYLYIVSILPSSSLAALSFETRIDTIKLLMKGKLKEPDEDLVLKIVYSFYVRQGEANLFLNFLLQKNNNVTNFETLFKNIDDKRISNISSIIAFFVPEKDNRRHFCYAVYELWKISDYNFNYIPSGVTPNADGINPQAYFLKPEGLKYYFDGNNLQINCVLEFSRTTQIINGLHTIDGVDIKADKELFGEKVYIYKIKYHQHQDDGHGGWGEDPTGLTVDAERFEYHLFQPISVVGYQPNLDLGVTIPTVPFPSFLFYYYEEFDRIKEMDAAISFGLDVIIEVGLFFATGGASVIADLRYLKYVTKIGRVFTGASTATEALFVWRGIDVGVQSFTVFSSVCMSYNNYLATVANTQDERDFREKTSRVFFYLTLAGAGGSIFTRTRTVRAAEEVLLDPKFAQLPDDVKNLITTLKGSKAVTMATFRSRISNRPNLLFKYDHEFTEAMRDAFFRDFEHIADTDVSIWAKLDNNAVLDNWKNLLNNGINERVAIDFITNQSLVNTILRFHNYNTLKAEVEALGYANKVKFLKDFANVDNATLDLFKDHSYSIQVWLKHTALAQTKIAENANTWLKYFKARAMLKTHQYNQIAQLFNKPIGASTIRQGIRYVTDGPFNPAALDKAIEIANRTDDVAAISNKLEIPFDILNRAKKHYYIDEHFMVIDNEFRIGRFERQVEENTEWLRMVDTPLEQLDDAEVLLFKQLIAHEYIEAKLMEKGVSFRSFVNPDNMLPFDNGAHFLSPAWNAQGKLLYQDVGRLSAPTPVVDLVNFSNLDKIVNWHINFYKL